MISDFNSPCKLKGLVFDMPFNDVWGWKNQNIYGASYREKSYHLTWHYFIRHNDGLVKKMHTKRNMKQLIFTWGQWKFPRNILQPIKFNNRTHKMTVTGRQTLGNGVFSIFGFIPTDVVFARIIPSSGWKFSNSARLIASPPTLLASCLALSSSHKKTKKFTKLASRLNQCSSQKANTSWIRKNDKCSPK